MHKARKIGQLEPYTFGDSMGVGLDIGEVFPDRNKLKLNPKSSVCFFKNGKKVSSDLKLLTQDLYSFAGSLFNEAEIEISLYEDQIKFLPKGYRPYSEYLLEEVLFKDPSLKVYEFKISP